MSDSSTPVQRLDLPPVPASAAEARHFVARYCDAARLHRDVCDTAVLLTSELVTNAIVHGRTSSELQVSSPLGLLRVLVHDDNPTAPERVRPGPDRRGGRGLILVEALASAWGFAPDAPGKSVWFEMRV